MILTRSLGRYQRMSTREASEEEAMTIVAAGITTSVDGFITGPNDEPGRGLGEGHDPHATATSSSRGSALIR